MRHELSVLAIGLSLSVACSGQIPGETSPGSSQPDPARPVDPARPAPTSPSTSAPPPTVPGPTPPAACQASPAAEGRLRRLTRAELNATFRDLFGDGTRAADALDLEPQVGLFYNSYADLWADRPFLTKYVPVASGVAERAAAKIRELHPCAWDGAGETGCVEAFVARAGERIFRQAVPADRARNLVGLYTRLRADSTPAEAMQGLLHAMLLAPEFLYRSEVLIGSQAATGDVGTRAQYQLAAQLSYLILGSTPDDELLTAARTGQLRTREQLGAQARRLLARPQGRDGALAFFDQLLELAKYEFMEKDPTLFPEFGPALVEDMKAETRALLKHVVFDAEGTLDALLTAPYSFIGPRLAKIYGVTGTVDAAKKTALPAQERAGLFTQAGLLAHLSPAAGTRPVTRGHFVLRNFLCMDLEPPPEAQQTLSDKVATAEMTTRQKFELHTTRPECASCHLLIDPIGFGLENYDALGRYRTREGTRPVDAKGVLAGTGTQDGPFEGGVQLATRLARSERLHGCFATQLFRYALGRKERTEDACVLDGLRASFTASKLSVKELLVATVVSDAFATRGTVQR